jgi:hypothetical protein
MYSLNEKFVSQCMWLHIPRILTFIAGGIYKLLLDGLKNDSHTE